MLSELQRIRLGSIQEKLRFIKSQKQFTIKNFNTSAVSNDKIGFIGLGQMGLHMLNNLYKKNDTPFIIYDVNQGVLDKVRTSTIENKPLKIASCPEEVASESSIVVTMLPESKHVKEVYFGEKGLFKSAKKNTIFIDSSTIDPVVSREVAIKMKEKGCVVVDAPVSGGILGAEAGSLTFMVGASNAQDFETVKTILVHMGKTIVYCGANGNGQVAKICNNMLLGIGMLGTAEAMNLGQKLGMDPKLLASILNASSGRCWSSDTYNPCPGVMENVPSSRDYSGGFGVSLMAKDMGLALDAANNVKANILLGALSQQVYNMVSKSEGYEKKDFSSVYKWIGGK